jgi:hypothetical protein
MNRKLPLIALAASAALVVPAGPATASDQGDGDQPYKVLAEGLVSPLHLAVGTARSVYVSQDFAATLSRMDRHGVDDIYVGDEGWDVAGVETRGTTTFFLESVGAGMGVAENLDGHLNAITKRGDVRTIANFADYERRFNPDGGQDYGLGPEASADCVAEATPPEPGQGPPPRYKGVIDSHPYALAVRGNTAFVADAGMNAILSVDLRNGHISTVAVLPPRPATISAGAAALLQAPGCAGSVYAFEPVPTDVEFGPDGWLYVTSLPGGPEDESLGARGAIFKINPWSGETKLWADGIVSPTGLAVANNGDMYVASLFGGEILKLSCWNKDRSVFLAVDQPADVEVQGRTLYATVNGLSGAPAGPGAAPPAGPFEGAVITADLR